MLGHRVTGPSGNRAIGPPGHIASVVRRRVAGPDECAEPHELCFTIKKPGHRAIEPPGNRASGPMCWATCIVCSFIIEKPGHRDTGPHSFSCEKKGRRTRQMCLATCTVCSLMFEKPGHWAIRPPGHRKPLLVTKSCGQ